MGHIAAFNPTAQGLFPALMLAIAAFVRFFVGPDRAVIGSFILPDQRLLLFPFEKIRLPAMIRTGNIPIRTVLAGAAACISGGCYHFLITAKGTAAADDLKQTCSVPVIQNIIRTKTKRYIPNTTIKQNESRYLTLNQNANPIFFLAVVFQQRCYLSAFFS